ncbi:structural cement protein Gp24 [Cupriavidus plantarum]|uniref:structural cement protein Gp24 n=1 Tax=Cupriavidus plantarum TaxID=942865 RepID=UPI00339D9A94
MGNAILYRMASGIPGDISRRSASTVEAVPLNSATPFAGYGLFGKIVSGKFVPVGAGDTASAVYGLLVRPYPTTGGAASDPLGTSTPQVGGIGDVMRRGYMTVKNNAGNPALNSQVYVRVAAAAAGKPIGGIEAAADSTNTIAITGAIFAGPADANGNVEIEYNI